MSETREKYWQCNNCMVLYPINARPDICICGNNMSVNSTKRIMIVYDAISETDEVENE